MRTYEKIVRELVSDGNESPKVDFKSQVDLDHKGTLAHLARTAIAMANTDSEDNDNFGFIVLGAERGQLIGGVDALSSDSKCASLSIALNNYITPPVRLEVKAWEDPSAGWFGVLVVRPSQAIRPHFVKRDYSPHEGRKGRMRANECYIRRGESIELASRDDFDRIYLQKFESQLRMGEAPPKNLPEPLVRWAIEKTPTRSVTIPRCEGTLARLHGVERDKLVIQNLNYLYLACQNVGAAPLNDATIFVNFPPELKVIERVPVVPDPRPLDRDSVLRTALERSFATSLPPVSRSTWLAFENEQLIKAGVTKLTHGGLYRIFKAPILLFPPSEEGSFEVRYSVVCDELPTPREGSLEVLVEANATRLLPVSDYFR